MSSSSSDSQANQTQTSTTQDNRISAASGSVNFSQSSGNTVTSDSHNTTNYTSIDDGAVAASYDYANKITAGAAKTAAASLDANAKVTKNAIDAVGDAYSGAMDLSKYSMSKLADGLDTANQSVSAAWSKATGSVVDMAKTALIDVQAANANSTASVAKAYENTSSTLADAYQTAKAGEQKIVSYVAIAVIGLVAVKVFGKS